MTTRKQPNVLKEFEQNEEWGEELGEKQPNRTICLTSSVANAQISKSLAVRQNPNPIRHCSPTLLISFPTPHHFGSQMGGGDDS